MNSYWLEENNLNKRNVIDNNYEADVCIIGAGISGLTTGYYLAKKGLKVIILDKDFVGHKASGHTTAKITLQHGLIYEYLIKSYGKDYAKSYFQANKEAISNIKKIIDEENIKCDFENKSNIVYTTNESEIKSIKNEVDAINSLEENYAEFIKDSDLPFKICGGIKIENQAQFHPVKYMQGLVNAIKNNEGLIFTNSTVTDIKKEENFYISYTESYNIKSKYVVIATHYPFINFPGFYFSKMYQVTSYALGVELDGKLPNEMYINAKEPTFSLRTAKYDEKNILIISGANHKTGFSPDTDETYGYKFLENELKKYYTNYKINYRWNTRDCITLDKIPYIGEFSSLMPNVYVETGYNKWGMTSSNVASKIISDKILENDNEYEDVFNSKRLKPIKNREELMNMTKQVFKSFVSNRIKIPEEDISAIKNDNGGIIKIAGNSVGIYKDNNGKIYAVNPTCTHLGCLLTWNNLDKTWDCPCHGSRFNFDGKNIYDPAFKDLKVYEIE